MENYSVVYIHFAHFSSLSHSPTLTCSYGARKSKLNIFDIPGCVHIAGYLHMTLQTAVSIETLRALRSDPDWCSCSILSTQEHNVAVITHGESSAVFSWKGESVEEYWDCILNALIYPEDYGKGYRPNLIVDDGVTWLFSSMRVRRRSTCSSRMVLSMNPARRTMLSSRLSKPSSRAN